MQRNWIGRSTGAHVDFPACRIGATPIEVFTTRPDTLFGATYLVLAPEHPLVDALTADGVAGRHRTRRGPAARRRPARRSRPTGPRRRQVRRRPAGRRGRRRPACSPARTRTNPVTGPTLPIFIADYVLMGYGTGAIMAVPGQDERDWEFAEVFELPIVRTVHRRPASRRPAARPSPATARRSTPPIGGLHLDGLAIAEAKAGDRSTGWRTPGTAGGDDLPAAGLAVQPAAVLGRAVPDRLRRDRPADRAAGVDAAGRAARHRRLLTRSRSRPTTPTPRRSRRWAG